MKLQMDITRTLSEPPVTRDSLAEYGMSLLDKDDLYERLKKYGKLICSKSSTNGDFLDVYYLDGAVYTLQNSSDNFTLTMDSTHWR